MHAFAAADGCDAEALCAQLQSALQDAVADMRFCAACGPTGGRLRACSRCKAVRYCGERCQREAWAAHKAVCVVAAGTGSSCGSCTGPTAAAPSS